MCRDDQRFNACVRIAESNPRTMRGVKLDETHVREWIESTRRNETVRGFLQASIRMQFQCGPIGSFASA